MDDQRIARARTLRGLVILLASAMALASSVLALSGCGGGSEGPALTGFTRDPAPQVGAVRLPDVGPVGKGAPTALIPARGDLLLVYFGYASCPDVCPTTLGDLRGAIAKLPARDRTRIEVAMVTVDPKRDTTTVLSGYLDHFFTRWRAYRSTDPRLLKAAENVFGASHIVQAEKGGGYSVVHSAFVYVVDDTGTVRVEWPFATRRTDIAADLVTLLGAAAGTTTAT